MKRRSMMNLMRKALLSLSLGVTVVAASSAYGGPCEEDHSCDAYQDPCGCHEQQMEEPKRSCDLDCGWGKVYHYGVDNNVVDIQKSVSSNVQLGNEFCMQVRAQAYEAAHDVVIKTTLPDGAVYVDSEPKAQVAGKELIWRVDEMCRKERRYFHVWMKAVAEGDLHSCSTVHAVPQVCACTTVGQPMLEICKEGPDVVVEGDKIYYDIQVTNAGTYPAYEVVVKDMIPDGMYHPSGERELYYCLGTLYPCDVKNIRVPLMACEPVKNVCNIAEVSACNAEGAQDQACTTVLRQGVALTKHGPDALFVCNRAEYLIRVSNTGENDLHDVRIVDPAPRGTQILDAPGASWDWDQAVWEVGTLAAGESQDFTVHLTSCEPNMVCNCARVTSCEGAMAEACYQTEFLGHPSLVLGICDSCDPICADEGTIYRVRIHNQGTAADTNISLVARFSDVIRPVSTRGWSEGKIAGQMVTFDVVDVLEAGEFVEFQIYGEAMQAGEGRVRVEVQSDKLREPLNGEESTYVY